MEQVSAVPFSRVSILKQSKKTLCMKKFEFIGCANTEYY